MATFSNKTFNSNLYAEFRPIYNKATYNLIYNYHAEKGGQFEVAVDVATGTGQVASNLADKFKQVHGTDLSARMLESGIKKDNVDYQACPAESLPFADASVDVITTFEAMHYFDLDRFFKEVKRVLKPKGTIAILVYNLPIIKDEPEMNTRFDKLVSETLADSWNKGMDSVNALYSDIHIPFQDIQRWFSPAAADVQKVGRVTAEPILEQKMSLNQFRQYCKTWSSYVRYLEKHSDDPIDEMIEDFGKIAKVDDLDSYCITPQWAATLILGTSQ
ncbi:S-adenosyl-L-methionine-dependent methyltransferase [Umbelopsis sp. PMI_123]|nr:S-adenosyl-L-methionine-dependent methyltransferase [Umbelopsis sp. PMI_123]